MAEEKFQDNNNKKSRAKGSQANAEGLSNYVFGKVQPQALQLEEAVLGALMLDREALPVVMDILRADSFYLEAHQHIYRAVIKLFERSNPVDILTVTEELRKSGDLEKVGGPYKLVELTNRIASAANIEYHARIIAQKHIQRELIRVSTGIIRDAYEDTTDVFDLLDDAEKGLFGITQNNLSRSYESMDTLSSKVLKQLEELSKKGDGLTGVPTGFTDLDRLTSGWQPSDMIILAARPGMGKTSMVLAMTLNAAKDFGKPVALFSLEMGSTQLVQRLISMEAEIEGSKMRNGKLQDWEWQQLQKTVDKLSSVPIYIDDTPGINIFELRAKCRRLKMQHDIQLVIIDYLQLMTGSSENNKSGNREQEISGISRALKNMAKELSVPVIALSQLSRAVETRGGSKRPQLSDLRECVTGDTLVHLADGRHVPIEALVGQQPNVWSIDTQTQKLKVCQSDLVWPVGIKPVYKITLASGRSIRATAEHRLFSISGWTTISSMKVNDRIAIARQIPQPLETLEMDEDKLVVLGHLIGDGSYLKHQPLRYTTASPISSSAVQLAAERAFGVTVNKHKGVGNWHQLVFSGNGNRWKPAGINAWFRELGIYNQRSHEKKIPSFVFQLNDHQLAFFLRHLWATDGTIFVPKQQATRSSCKIAFSTNSAQLAYDVAALLLRFQIVTRTKTVKQGAYRPMYCVEVSGKTDQMNFLKKIGIFGDKIERAQQLHDFIVDKFTNTNVDTLPVEIFEKIKTSMKDRGVSHRQMASLRGTSYGGSRQMGFAPSRTVLESYATLLEDTNLHIFANSDLFWDTITSIEYIGEEQVFDLTVPETAAWFANGILSHNSGAIEQDADIVSFIYRPEYYGILEDEEGQPLKGIAEFIVAKNRHGALDTIRIKFMDSFAKFGNLDDPTFSGLESPLSGPFTPSTVLPSRMNDEDIPF